MNMTRSIGPLVSLKAGILALVALFLIIIGLLWVCRTMMAPSATAVRSPSVGSQ